ncbi:MAG TPA: ATPase, partial [Rhodospirillaceae bacterium]|nr:ATPase [Rhodospirillaceae bacterium]
MLKPDMKRFYREVTVAPAEDDPSVDEPRRAAFRILLDGREVKTPIGKALAVPTQALADAVAEEWDAQAEKIQPASMPLTQLAFTALDRVAPECAVIAERIADYGGTDLVCYRAEAPQDLVQRQADAWDPLLDWAKDEWEAQLQTTAGIVPVEQDAAAMAALSKVVGA